ncbi:MAG: hypothetical protein NTU41_01385 [Chloroflexi bacterium]|nr:hypothetical protein [Chloroflexota bacterium]
MELDKAVEALEGEFKLIKGQLKQTMVDVRDFLQAVKLPAPNYEHESPADEMPEPKPSLPVLDEMPSDESSVSDTDVPCLDELAPPLPEALPLDEPLALSSDLDEPTSDERCAPGKRGEGEHE